MQDPKSDANGDAERGVRSSSSAPPPPPPATTPHPAQPITNPEPHVRPEHDPNARPECFTSTIQECLFVMSVTMAVAMSAFLTGSITVMSYFAARDLHMTNAEITWMNAASSLSSGALLLFFGSIADLFGRKSMFIISMLLFSIFCLGAGFAKSGLVLDILCGVLGIFSASAVPPAQGMMGVAYKNPSPRKNKAFGCFSAGNPLGFVFGSIFSGLVTQVWSWRASFWLLAIVYLVTTIVAAFTVPHDGTKKVEWNAETVKKLDLPGTGMTILGVGLFCAALSLGGDAPQAWKTPYVLVFLILGIAIIAVFVVWEMKYPYAMIDMKIWKDRDFSLLLIILSCGFLGFPIMSFWIALYFQTILGFSSLQTGVHLLPMVIMGLLANLVAALLLHKVSNKLLMGIGAFAYVFSFVLVAVQRHGDSYWAFSFPGLCLCVIGADFQFNVANMYVLSSMPQSKQSIAGSLLQTITRLCQAVGYGGATAIFNAVQANPARSGYYANNAVEPYAAVFWFSAGVAVLGLFFLPWLGIGTQGHEGDKGRLTESRGSDIRIDNGGLVGEKGRETDGVGVIGEIVVQEKDIERGV
ncbi:major facilitator superfamily domain-containing protein [Clohesyomyces aquaticus]|uniref:Major facilitator superfamily domain-containing protein n=1 Tax=Clohesyomyces aquaticus TaxID=1231657 RepID=A0A1Y1Z3L8_9PLEO|nr:major facilitator superfamily domain-containing protein [Clohesyomyces aquaticus]